MATDAMTDAGEKLRHKIGSTRSIRTAVLVCEYLAERLHGIHRDRIHYHFTDPTERNGWWSADIIVDTFGKYDDKELSRAVDLCRAFVAGCGEIW